MYIVQQSLHRFWRALLLYNVKRKQNKRIKELSEEMSLTVQPCWETILLTQLCLLYTSSHHREEGLSEETEIPDTIPESPAMKQRRKEITVEKAVGRIMERFVIYQEKLRLGFYSMKNEDVEKTGSTRRN